MLFTYNPTFRQDRNPTARRAALVQHFDDCLNENGIDVKRIVYVGEETGESRSYVSESPALLRNFFEHYKVQKCAVILSDLGGSFVDQGKSYGPSGFKTPSPPTPPPRGGRNTANCCQPVLGFSPPPAGEGVGV